MFNILKHYKKLFSFLLLIGLIFVLNIGVSFATREPDVIVKIDNNKIEYQGDLLANVTYGWYPGQVKEGILRIQNDSSRNVRINNIDVALTLKKAGITIDQSKYEYKIFALTLKDGEKFLYPASDNSNLPLNLRMGDFIDLDYRVEMDKRSGNELQKTEAQLAINMGVNEQVSQSDSNGGDSDKTKAPADTAGHWAHDCILALLKYGIIELEPNGTVRPNDYITRAETAVLIGRALKLQEKPGSPTIYLDDEHIPAWARGYVAATYEAGVMVGYELYPGREFRPMKHTPREELSCVLVRSFIKDLNGDIMLPFTDQDQISSWATNDVKAAVKNKILVGYPDQTFKPKQPMTRAEAFTIVCKLLEHHAEHTHQQ